VAYPRSHLSYLADVAEHAPCGKEHDAEAQKYDKQPQKEEAKAELRQHPQLVPLGKSEIDMAAIAYLLAGNSKRDWKSRYAHIRWLIGQEFSRFNRLKVRLSIAGTHPKLKESVGARLQKKYGIVGVAL
jgi:hypothetical protein